MGTWFSKDIYGGIAQGDQVDRPASFAFAKNVNFRRKHDVWTLNQRLSKDSGTVIDALPHWIKDLQGTVFTYLANGKIFERIAASSWVLRKTVPASGGQGFGVDASFAYYANASFLGKYALNASWVTQASDTFQQITGSSWNPIRYFAKVNLLLVGNNNKIASFDYAAGNFSASRLSLPGGWFARDIEFWGDYAAISCWTGSSIRASAEGKLILWDGLSERFNAIIDSQAGNILFSQTDKNFLNVMAGVIGNIYRVNAGELFQIRKIPFVNEDGGDWLDVYPGAKATFKGIPHFGVAGNGSGASYFRGVYSFGSDEGGIPSSLNMEYTISEDLGDNNVAIGSIHTASNADFYVGWKNASTFGIDKLDTTQQYASGYLETLQFHGSPGEEGYLKTPKKVHMTYLPLISGQSITMKIRRDMNASYATVLNASTPSSVADQTTQLAAASHMAMPTGRYFQMRIELAGISGMAPYVVSNKVDYDVRPTS